MGSIWFWRYSVSWSWKKNLCTIIRGRLNRQQPKRETLKLSNTYFPLKGVKTGDKEFDYRILLEGNPPEFALTVVASPILRKKLIDFGLKGTIRVFKQVIYYEELGFTKDADYFRSIFDLICDISEAVEEVSYGKG